MGSLLKKQNGSQNELFNPFFRFQKEFTHAMNDFYDFLGGDKGSLTQFSNVNILPSMDIVEDQHCYKLEVEMPGLCEEDVNVSVNRNVLTIEAEKTTSKKDEKKNYICREINYGRYARSISLPLNADMNKIDASFKKGMLWINIPKLTADKSLSKKISVKKADKS